MATDAPPDVRKAMTANAKIGSYEVVGQLATGGMAEILLARLIGPSGFERPVVIKRILPHLVKAAGMAEMFVDEARILARLRHANVVQVDTLGEHEGAPYLAMEYLAGESAAGLIRRLVSRHQRLPIDLAAFVLAEACAGLHAAHELRDTDGATRGLVHRDVSPQNIFITYDGAVKVLDFGIAKANDRIARTETGQLKGKFQYMSPEQTRADPLDRRSDVFSLGIVLYELATTRSLFSRRTHLLTMRAICEEPIAHPSRVSSDVPKAIDVVCLRALKREREERYATAAAMRKELLPLVQTGAGEEPSERLAALMRELFADRIAEKDEMLKRVRTGTAIAELPAGDADELVSVPSVAELVDTQAHATVAMPHTERTGRRTRVAVIGAVTIAAAGSLALVIMPRKEPLATPPSAAASISSPIAFHPAVAAVTAPASSMVVVRIESTPDGARIVVAGRDGGTTPAELTLARGTEPVPVALEKAGFARSSQTIVPDADAKLVVTLVRDRRAPVAPAAPAKSAAPRGSAAPFERFD